MLSVSWQDNWWSSQSHHSITEPTSPCPFLIMPSFWWGTDMYTPLSHWVDLTRIHSWQFESDKLPTWKTYDQLIPPSFLLNREFHKLNLSYISCALTCPTIPSVWPFIAIEKRNRERFLTTTSVLSFSYLVLGDGVQKVNCYLWVRKLSILQVGNLLHLLTHPCVQLGPKWLLVPPITNCWQLLAPVGTFWKLLALTGICCNLLVTAAIC